MKSLSYDTKYIFTKTVGKGVTKELFECLSEIVGIDCESQGNRCLLANLFLAVKNNHTRMKIASANTFYSVGIISYQNKVKTDVSRTQAKRFIISLVNIWNCEHIKGNNLSPVEDGGYRGGMIEFSENLIYEIKTMGFDDLIEEVESMKKDRVEVSLKKFKNIKSQIREEVTFTPDEQVKLMKKVIAKYNTFISNFDVRFNGVKLDCDVYRLFLDDTDHYGRFHNAYQTIPSLDRSRILINGESVVEVDIVSSHPSILLSEVGIDPQEVTIYNFGKVNDKLQEVYGDDFPLVDRKTIKPFVLLAINCDSKDSCIRALINKPEIKELFGSKHDVYNLILSEIEDWLSPIAHKFYKGDGLRLMKIESDIVFGVMDLVEQYNIPTLFVHDSFICRLSDLHDLLYYIEVAMLACVNHELRLEVKKPQKCDS